jgi:antitoxin MazE
MYKLVDTSIKTFNLVTIWENNVNKVAKLTIQQWGNSLAVRIPAAVARSARFVVGQPVDISVDDLGLVVKRAGQPKLSLTQKLALFDPVKHGAEVMVTTAVGTEAM